jgi:uncharacterized protein (DUF488 family)
MSAAIYTLGYAQWSVPDVARECRDRGAILVDLRRGPQTTKPGFSTAALTRRFGDAFVHVPAFGNDNRSVGPVALAVPERGVERVRALSAPPVLMCGCRSPAQCHRRTGAALLVDRQGGTVTPLRPPAERAQGDLFSDRAP